MIDFAAAEHSVFSQAGEDGVIEALFERIEPVSRYVVEIGAGDGVRYSNARNLVVNHGWASFQVEGNERKAGRLADNYAEHPDTKALCAQVWPGNIELLMHEAGVPIDLDLLVIDLDGNDWYVWRAIHDFQPKVVMVEYNASFAPPQCAVVDYHPFNCWVGTTDYYGASLQSYCNLGKQKGYELVYCNALGTNAFFVRSAYFDLFDIPDNSAGTLYKPPQYGVTACGRAPNGRGYKRFENARNRIDVEAFQIPCRMVER